MFTAGTLFQWFAESNNTKGLEYLPRISDFYDTIILPMVYADLGHLLEKYLKRGKESWA
jgi:hypothetical protein